MFTFLAGCSVLFALSYDGSTHSGVFVPRCSDFKLTDMDEWPDSDEGEEDESGEDGEDGEDKKKKKKRDDKGTDLTTDFADARVITGWGSGVKQMGFAFAVKG